MLRTASQAPNWEAKFHELDANKDPAAAGEGIELSLMNLPYNVDTVMIQYDLLTFFLL